MYIYIYFFFWRFVWGHFSTSSKQAVKCRSGRDTVPEHKNRPRLDGISLGMDQSGRPWSIPRTRKKQNPKRITGLEIWPWIKAIPWKPIFRSIASSYHLWLCFRKCIQIYNLELTSLEIQKMFPVSRGVSLAVVDFFCWDARFFFGFRFRTCYTSGGVGLETFQLPWKWLLLVEFLFWNLWVGVWCLGFSSFFLNGKKNG